MIITCLVIWKIFRFIVLGTMLDISVMFLIVTPNAINIFFGWDGLGLVSHLLVFGACMLNVL